MDRLIEFAAATRLRSTRARRTQQDDTDWRNRAACLTVHPDLFFPVGSTGPAVGQIDEAREVCRACPVRDNCLTWAITNDAGDGIWGGLTAEERRRYARQRSKLLRAANKASTGA